MVSDLPPIATVGDAAPGTANVVWDPDSMVLLVDVVYAATPSDESFRARVDATLGVKPPELRLVIGDADVLLDELGRPTSFELRSNPSRWSGERPAAGEAKRGQVSLAGEFDENGIGSVDASVEVAYDRGTGGWTAKFAGLAAQRWVQIADGVTVGLSSDDRWAEFSVAGLVVPG